MNAEKLFMDYASGYDAQDGMIDLKIVHTRSVAKIMERLTAALDLTESQRKLALVCAWFHDIGRFEQIRRYHTFFDNLSVNHAELSCEILQQEDFLKELEEKEAQMVLTAIRNHNRLAIEEGLEEETLLLCKLIRDADKTDIFRVFCCEEMVDTMGETEEQVSKETISDCVYEQVMRHCCIDRTQRNTGLDKWITYLGFFFDMNYREAFVISKEEGYYRRPFERNTFENPESAKRVAAILEEIENYVDEKIRTLK